MQTRKENQKKQQIIFQKPFDGFISKFEIVSCHIENDGKLLFLKRAKDKAQPNTWGVPAGKKDNNETIQDALIREVFEETSLKLEKNHLSYFKKVYVRYPDYDFIYHIFLYKLSNQKITITLNPNEHTSYRWLSIKDSLSGVLPLILGEEACISLLYKNY